MNRLIKLHPARQSSVFSGKRIGKTELQLRSSHMNMTCADLSQAVPLVLYGCE
jgi:hypothetical protein